MKTTTVQQLRREWPRQDSVGVHVELLFKAFGLFAFAKTEPRAQYGKPVQVAKRNFDPPFRSWRKFRLFNKVLRSIKAA